MQKIGKNVKKCQKIKIIAKFQKLLNMVIKLQKLTKTSNNVKKKKMPKTAKNGQISNIFSSFFWLETTSKNVYSELKQLKMD